jgi:hypothetical protein
MNFGKNNFPRRQAISQLRPDITVEEALQMVVPGDLNG